MATTVTDLDWSGCSLIHCDLWKMGGIPIVDGIRLTPETILEHYEGGFSIPEIVGLFPAVNEEQVRTVLSYATSRGYLIRPLAA